MKTIANLSGTPLEQGFLGDALLVATDPRNANDDREIKYLRPDLLQLGNSTTSVALVGDYLTPKSEINLNTYNGTINLNATNTIVSGNLIEEKSRLIRLHWATDETKPIYEYSYIIYNTSTKEWCVCKTENDDFSDSSTYKALSFVATIYLSITYIDQTDVIGCQYSSSFINQSKKYKIIGFPEIHPNTAMVFRIVEL